MAYVVLPAGWNLVSFADLTSLQVVGGGSQSPVAGPLYTFQPNDRNYESTDLGHVTPGEGYWVDVTQTFSVVLDTSTLTSTHVAVPAGQCVMVGNPSTLGTARVTGADAVFSFSAVANQYVQGTWLGVGRGAWACNYSNATETVTTAYDNSITTTDIGWPGCCDPQPVNNGGQAVVVFHNDTPSPLIAGMRQLDATGNAAPLTLNNFFRSALSGCSSCPEYTQHPSCNAAAPTDSASLAPGTYTLHLESDEHNVGDIQVTITLAPDTQYSVCFFLFADRAGNSQP